MLLSMTGYGRATHEFAEKTITVEVRSLNSKFTDVRFKIPQNYREREADLRKMVSQQVERGKIDVTISVKSLSGDDEYALNKALFKKYHLELTQISDELQLSKENILQSILRLPNVVSADEQTLSEAEAKAVEKATSEAIVNFTAFRRAEGIAMEEDCKKRIANILNDLSLIAPFEKERVEKLRARMLQNMDEYVGKDNIDANRFEQEILYYLEKIDVTEEKVRLEQHCKYFLEQLATKQTLKGRKLSFISQEMGREINTLGSKANSSDIQRLVVQMKDELEKIKEQVANTV